MQSDGFQVIHINFLSAKVDNVYFPQWEVVGDISNALWQIKERIRPQEHWDFSYFMRMKDEVERHIAQGSDEMRVPIIPQSLVALLREAMPDNGILSLDNGMFKIWFARNYKAYMPNTLLLDNALATMGAGLSAAIAAALVHPDKKILAVVGDGGFLMNSQELETAVRLGLHIGIVVLRDNGYGMIKWKQEGMGLPSFGLDFGNPDFVKYAESYGAHACSHNSVGELRECFQECLARPGVHLIEVPIDYSENDRVLNKELKEKTCLL